MRIEIIGLANTQTIARLKEIAQNLEQMEDLDWDLVLTKDGLVQSPPYMELSRLLTNKELVIALEGI